MALKEAGMNATEVDGIAYTRGPGEVMLIVTLKYS
jgi:tRNA A37 threonylcarbamoyladenosine modification protein TsaB